MSRLFGPMRQVGIVVRDIEKAMRHWVEACGVGPVVLRRAAAIG
jgi:Glyoxalase/Bleomycin resistance protein/Dioxygenase superfamily